MNLTPEELERKFYIENNPLYYQLVNLIDGHEEQLVNLIDGYEEQLEDAHNIGYKSGKTDGYRYCVQRVHAELAELVYAAE